ncbi:hypothetical protein DL98DRAFT_534464 [Cadophora sp. DSE1049]|nr:hypothetical protein DL98DRAFT_534464 [Cadophora sp. DSE1049]
MTTLALNSMTQPCGKFPLICVLDIVFFLSRWAHAWIYSKRNFRQAFFYVIAERFSDSSPAEGIQALGQSIGMRWLLFILGPLPQAIRLAGFQAVFWSKLFGFSFVIPWLVMEGLILVAGRFDIPRNTETTNESRDPYDLQTSFRRQGEVDLIVWISLGLSLGLVLGYAEMVFIAKLMMVLNPFFQIIVMSLSCVFAVIVMVVLLGLLFWGLYTFFSRHLWLGTNLLLTARDEYSNILDVQVTALTMLIFCMVNFCLCVYGYGWYYDPTGTLNPGWTGVFG